MAGEMYDGREAVHYLEEEEGLWWAICPRCHGDFMVAPPTSEEVCPECNLRIRVESTPTES